MLQSNITDYQPKTNRELALDVAFLVAEGALSFHPTSPICEKIRLSTYEYLQFPESKLSLVEVLMKNCEQEFTEIALSSLGC